MDPVYATNECWICGRSEENLRKEEVELLSSKTYTTTVGLEPE
jgi:hypothetical protein